MGKTKRVKITALRGLRNSINVSIDNLKTILESHEQNALNNHYWNVPIIEKQWNWGSEELPGTLIRCVNNRHWEYDNDKPVPSETNCGGIWVRGDVDDDGESLCRKCRLKEKLRKLK